MSKPEIASLGVAYELLFVASHRPQTRGGLTPLALGEMLRDVRRVWLIAEALAADPSRLVDGLRISASYTLNCVVIATLVRAIAIANADERARGELDRLLREARSLSAVWAQAAIPLARQPDFLREFVASASGIGVDDIPPLSPGGDA